MLNSYGRGMSESISTFSYEGQGSFMGMPWTDDFKDPTGLLTTLKADVQADFRSVHVSTQVPGLPEPIVQDIHMESTFKGAIHVGKTTDLVFSRGLYGNNRDLEDRVYYLAVRSSKYLTFQFGRFLPAFGIMLDDHTAITRGPLGLGQGNEALNLAVHFEDENFQTTFTKVFGEDVVLTSDVSGVSYESEVQDRYVLRSGVKWTTKFVTGVNLLYDERTRIVGGYLLWAPIKDRIYFMGEADVVQRLTETTKTQSLTYFTRTGSEIFRGMTVGLDLSGEDTDTQKRRITGLYAQFFPTTHLEVKAESRTEGEVKSFIIMVHAWI